MPNPQEERQQRIAQLRSQIKEHEAADYLVRKGQSVARRCHCRLALGKELRPHSIEALLKLSQVLPIIIHLDVGSMQKEAKELNTDVFVLLNCTIPQPTEE